MITTTERLRIIENDSTGGMITAQINGSQSILALRIITGYLDCNPGDIWIIEYDAEAIGDDPRGLLWLVDARLEKAAKRQFMGIQLELFAA